MPLEIGLPDNRLLRAAKKELKLRPEIQVLPIREQRRWVNLVGAAIPRVGRHLRAVILRVESPARFCFLLHLEPGPVVIDDRLRARTFLALEEQMHMGSRSLVPWSLFAVVFGQELATTGARDPLPFAQQLLRTMKRSIAERLDENGRIQRPDLLPRGLAYALSDGELPDTRIRRPAATLFSSFHEIGHVIGATDTRHVKEAVRRLRSLLTSVIASDDFDGLAGKYWEDPAKLDTGYGSTRLQERDVKAINDELRERAIEELFCDWFSVCLLLLSPECQSLEPDQILEIAARQIAWGQVLLDFRDEVRYVPRQAKRWRGVVCDSGAVRQHLLPYALHETALAELVFGSRFARGLFERLHQFDMAGWLRRIDLSITKRQYLRFLGMYYPMPEDLRFIDGADKMLEEYHKDRSMDPRAVNGKVLIAHQLAPWGVNDSRTLTDDVVTHMIDGRLDKLSIEWDDVDVLAPYVGDAYHLINRLRRDYWGFFRGKPDGYDPGPSPTMAEIAEGLNRIWRFVEGYGDASCLE